MEDDDNVEFRAELKRYLAAHVFESRGAAGPDWAHLHRESLRVLGGAAIIRNALKIISLNHLPWTRGICLSDKKFITLIEENDRDVDVPQARPDLISNLGFQPRFFGELSFVGSAQHRRRFDLISLAPFIDSLISRKTQNGGREDGQNHASAQEDFSLIRIKRGHFISVRGSLDKSSSPFKKKYYYNTKAGCKTEREGRTSKFLDLFDPNL